MRLNVKLKTRHCGQKYCMCICVSNTDAVVAKT